MLQKMSEESASPGVTSVFAVQVINSRHRPPPALITHTLPEAFCYPIDKVVRVNSEMAFGELC